jgi:GTPase Era involved in 16S rRNA processing
MQIKPITTVIVFGETGAGKSSIINMLAGRVAAKVSSSSSGCTFKSESHRLDINGSTCELFDTVGLNEGKQGTVSPTEAIVRLYKLIHSLKNGVNLLVYCVRGPRIRETIVNNYKMFYSVFCKQQVPILLVVTGLENEESMDTWWDENQSAFTEHGMHFSGHVCGTATKGKDNRFAAEYEETLAKLRRLIERMPLAEPWKMETTGWFVTVMKGVWNDFARLFGWGKIVFSEALYRALKEHSRLSENDAARVTNETVIEVLIGPDEC